MSVQVQIGADVTQFDAAIKSLPEKISSASKKMASVAGGGNIGAQLTKMLPAVSMAAGVAGIRNLMGAADDLADAAMRLDTTPEVFQRVEAAAQILGGTSMETVTSALIRLRRQLIEDPGGDLAKGLQQVGIETDNFLKLDADEQIMALADAYKVAQQEGSALPLLNEAFGKSFKELIPLLSSGGDEISKFYSSVVVASDDAVQRLAVANDRVDRFITSIKNWSIEALGSIIGHAEAAYTDGQSVIDEQGRAEAAALAARKAREAQAAEAAGNRKKQAIKRGEENIMDAHVGAFEKFNQQVQAGIPKRLQEMANQSATRAKDLVGAMGTLRGDMDTSTGRSAFNPLRADGSKQLSEMARQTAALRRVAQTGDKQTSLLQSIDNTIRRLNLIPKYS